MTALQRAGIIIYRLALVAGVVWLGIGWLLVRDQPESHGAILGVVVGGAILICAFGAAVRYGLTGDRII